MWSAGLTPSLLVHDSFPASIKPQNAVNAKFITWRVCSTPGKELMAMVGWPGKGSVGKSHKTGKIKQSQQESSMKADLVILSAIQSPKINKIPRRKTNALGEGERKAGADLTYWSSLFIWIEARFKV